MLIGLTSFSYARRATVAMALSWPILSTVDIARAQDASAWVRDNYSAVRLLAGSHTGSERILVGGIEFQLQPGWKTYWRIPGDSGVPPRFDFGRSENIDSVTVLWPAPNKFADGAGGQSIGYRDKVVLPLRIVPKDPAKPAILRADINYAVCEKLCVPVEAVAEIAFTSSTSSQDSALAAALGMVPAPPRKDDPVGLRNVTFDAARRRIVVAILMPGETAIDVFAEGPTAEWSMSIPKLVDRAAPGLHRFAFDLDGIPAGSPVESADFRLTLVGGPSPYELTFKVK